jgi:hypothetical protein
MAIYILKRRTFSSDDKNSGLGKKLAIGGALAGTAALGFMGAQKGMLGSGLQKSSNTFLMRAGKTLNSAGMQNAGMKGLANAQTNIIKDSAAAAGKTVTDEAAKRSGQLFAKNQLEKVNGTSLWGKDVQSVMRNSAEVNKAKADLTKSSIEVGDKVSKLDNSAVNTKMKDRLQRMVQINATPPTP